MRTAGDFRLRGDLHHLHPRTARGTRKKLKGAARALYTPEPTDAELAAYHKAHEQQFVAPEQASIEYVVLDLATLGRDLPLPEAEVPSMATTGTGRASSAKRSK